MIRIANISTKHLLLVTTFGWIFTFFVLVTQQPEMPGPVKRTQIKNQYTEKAVDTIEIPEGEHRSQADFEVAASQTGSGGLINLEKPIADLISLRSDIMEMQYMLSGRRKDWSDKDKQMTQDLIDHLWRESYSILEEISGNECRQKLQQSADEIWKHIDHIQKRDCSDTRNKFAVCSLNKPCGFGCQLHHLNWCFMLSFALNRTMVLENGAWSYDKKGWTDMFQPLTGCNLEDKTGPNIDRGSQSESVEKERVVRIPIVDSMGNSPLRNQFFLPNIPSKWARKMSHCHSNPTVWYAAQFIAYSMRPNEKLSQHLHSVQARTQISHNFFGIHVRRSDKKSEAKYHDLAEYMEYVKVVQNRLEKTDMHINKEIYLATDEPTVLMEETKAFPEYTFHGDTAAAQRAGSGGTRYAEGSLLEVLADVIFMSKSQYLVCTFSSQVCRVSYELMQYERRYEDAGWRWQSLDDFYYYGGQGFVPWYVIDDHSPGIKGESRASKGDRVGVLGNHWDGYSKTHQGLLPSYKLRRGLPTFELTWSL